MASFLTAFGLTLFVFALVGIYPFGENSILTNDLRGQYISFFSYLRGILTGDQSILYTFSKTLGGDMAGFGAYYLLSPVNLVLLIFPVSHLPSAVALITLIKIGLCGLTSSIYLNRLTPRWGSLMFSAAYAMMAYNMVYQQNIMWLDAVALLPLVIMGIERIADGEGGRLLYPLALGGAIISNYYIGYMLCIFSLLYFIIYITLLSVKSFPCGILSYLGCTGRFIAGSLIGGGLSAFVILPMYYSLQGGKAVFDLTKLTAETLFPIKDIVSKYYTGSYNFQQIQAGLPNIYCGILMLLFAVIFYANRKTPVKHKIGITILLAVLTVSFYVKGINLFWHAANEPIWFPFRYSFLFSFVIITAAYKGYCGLDDYRFKGIVGAGASVFALFAVISAFVQKSDYAYLDPVKIYITTGIMLAGVIFVSLAVKYRRRIFPVILTFLCLADLTCNGYLTLKMMAYFPYERYRAYVEETKPAVYNVMYGDNSFYRMEKTFEMTVNDPMLFGYRGLSHYSSSEKQFVKNFMGHIGFRNAGYWTYYNKGSTIAADSLLGVKYILTYDSMPLNNGYPIIRKSGNIAIWQNPYALPIGFVVNTVTPQLLESHDTFKRQNALWQTLCPDDAPEMFYRTPAEVTELKGIAASYVDNVTEYKKNKKNGEGEVVYTVTAESSDPLYMYLETPKFRECELFVNGQTKGLYFDNNNYNVIFMGCFEAGEQVQLSIQMNRDTLTIGDAMFYHQSMTQMKNGFDKLNSQPYNITSRTGSSFSGEVTVLGDSKHLLFSIPYQSGWHITVDGIPVQASPAFGGMMSVPINQGNHAVSMKYTPEGMYAGIVISVAAAVILAVWMLMVHLYKRKRIK